MINKIFIRLLVIFVYSSIPNDFYAADDSMQSQTVSSIAEPQISSNLETDKDILTNIPKRRKKYYSKVVLRDILTDNDCKVLIDLNESLSLIEKYFKERQYERAKDLLKIIFNDVQKIKDDTNERLLEKLKLGFTLKDFKQLYKSVKSRRYPSNCSYNNIKHIEKAAVIFDKKVDSKVFEREAKILDKTREVKMREHIEKALVFLEEKKYYKGRLELIRALELCNDFQTIKILKQRIREVADTIKHEKRKRAKERKRRS